MTLLPSDQKNIDDFFANIESQRDGYQELSLTYLAVRHGDQFQLVRGRLSYNAVPPMLPFTHFESTSIRAGQYRLSELNIDDKALLQQILAGKIETPHGPLSFPAPTEGRHATSFVPMSPDALQVQRRVSVLTIMGGQAENRSTSDLDWELKVASVPYDRLQELMSEYAINPSLRNETITVEFVAFNVAGVDGQKSAVTGEQTTIHVVLAPRLNREKFSLAYRVYSPDGPTIRAVAPGSAFTWTDEQTQQRGVLTLQVPIGALLNCVPTYDGIGQTYYWLIDPARSANPRRAVHEAFDPQLETVKDIIRKALRKGQEARDLESAVGWLLWMLGFSVAQLGGIPRTQDAADLIAVTPSGHFAVIECTTGLLKADNKLPLLHDRAQAVRRALEASRHNHLRVLPVIVTTKTRDEVHPDIEQAERLGILVVTKETLEQAIERTARMPASDQIYEDAFQEMRTAQAKHEKQGITPVQVAPGTGLAG